MEKHLTSQSNVIPSAKGRKQPTNDSYLQGPTYQGVAVPHKKHT